ncbi:MAG: hypothetical protein IJH34_07120 [Romboutsia sp.]|nr:hypothetical protein [Romboutsia sp.]
MQNIKKLEKVYKDLVKYSKKKKDKKLIIEDGCLNFYVTEQDLVFDEDCIKILNEGSVKYLISSDIFDEEIEYRKFKYFYDSKYHILEMNIY